MSGMDFRRTQDSITHSRADVKLHKIPLMQYLATSNYQMLPDYTAIKDAFEWHSAFLKVVELSPS